MRPVVQVAAQQVDLRPQVDLLDSEEKQERSEINHSFVLTQSSRPEQTLQTGAESYLEIPDVGEEEADEGQGQRPLGHGADEVRCVALRRRADVCHSDDCSLGAVSVTSDRCCLIRLFWGACRGLTTSPGVQ